ncbi:uncharacterized protein BJ212DRAFT_553683 [Suillus subaureus]|uniref:Uncharacterized protein n=1 Tax=Suillus subaureus TaxID=48587 RepID=A0A9P7JIV4_9AGAM|nr:uncharacterized protein BJ212DRAFT_553683 [Suillus subaureus]KAG1824908.1 hypothetical protein BJ212DRAFT_553683 [Suillus subaureus]
MQLVHLRTSNMADWHRIIFGNPMSGHSMLPLVIQVMQWIYSTVDPERPPPFTVDNWWHLLSLSYQVEESGREPSIIILNLREGEPDQPVMNTHFMINLITMGALWTIVSRYPRRSYLS